MRNGYWQTQITSKVYLKSSVARLLGLLDFRKVQRVDTTFISPITSANKNRIWCSCCLSQDTDETEVMIYILIEHQSTVDPRDGISLTVLYVSDLGPTTGNSGYRKMCLRVRGDFVRSFLCCFTQVKRDGKRSCPLRR